MVGFVSTIVAGVRLYSIRVYTLSTEPVREAAPINLWSFIEVNLGMLCASGPGEMLASLRGGTGLLIRRLEQSSKRLLCHLSGQVQ